MKNNFLQRLLNGPISTYISITAIVILTVVARAQGVLDTSATMIIIGAGLLIGLVIQFGFKFLKGVLSAGVIVYATSLYTLIIANVNDMIVQPFFLTLAMVAIFLAQSYSSKDQYFGLRSRSAFSLLLAVTLISLKGGLALTGVKYSNVEFIGVLFTIAYILLWRFWLKNSKKTKVVEPAVTDKIEDGQYRYIYIKNTLDLSDFNWTRGKFSKPENAYPYIYNEVLKAKEENLILAIISNLTNSKSYFLGEIETFGKNIPYLYIETKDNKYVEKAIIEIKKEQEKV